MKRFKNGHVIAHFGKISCTSQSRRTRAYDCHFMILFFLCRLWLDAVLSRPVRSKTLQLSNGNWLSFDSPDAFSLTLAFLRTHTPADCRKGAGLADHLVSLLKIAFFDLGDKSWNVNRNRTPFDTLCIFTVYASLSLLHCFFFIITQAHFVKIRRAHLWLLLSYWYFL